MEMTDKSTSSKEFLPKEGLDHIIISGGHRRRIHKSRSFELRKNQGNVYCELYEYTHPNKKSKFIPFVKSLQASDTRVRV